MVRVGTPLSGVPVDLSRDEAQQAAREELSKQMYRESEPSWLDRLIARFFEELGELLARAGEASPGGFAGLAVMVLLVVIAIVAIRLKVGPLARTAAGDTSLFTGRPRSSRDYRAAADAHASAGEWAAAVRERMRAIIRSLEERDLLDPRPGRTADEGAAEAGVVLPTCAAQLRAAARTFDDIWYGGRAATAAADAQLREIDRLVQAARPVSPALRSHDQALMMGSPE